MKKVIVITGASSGMGKETAKKLIGEGHIVYTLARRIEQMEDLKNLGGHPIKMDISNEEEVTKAVQTIIEKEGRIDVLWNNAGFGLYGSVEDVPLEEARKQIRCGRLIRLFALRTQAIWNKCRNPRTRLYRYRIWKRTSKQFRENI